MFSAAIKKDAWASTYRHNKAIAGLVSFFVFAPCIYGVMQSDMMVSRYQRTAPEDIGAHVIIESLVALRDGKEDPWFWSEELCALDACDMGPSDIVPADVRALASTCLAADESIGVRDVHMRPRDMSDVMPEHDEVEWTIVCEGADVAVVVRSEQQRWWLVSMRRLEKTW